MENLFKNAKIFKRFFKQNKFLKIIKKRTRKNY